MFFVSKISFLLPLLTLSSAYSQRPHFCFELPNTGNCRAFLPSYFYNPQTGSCDCFVFGGCSGGRNNFNSLESCMQVCHVNPASQVMSAECGRIHGSSNQAQQPSNRPPVQQRPEVQPPPQPFQPVQPPQDSLTPEQMRQLQAIFSQLSPTQAAQVQQQLVQSQQTNQQNEPKQQSQPSFEQALNGLGVSEKDRQQSIGLVTFPPLIPSAGLPDGALEAQQLQQRQQQQMRQDLQQTIFLQQEFQRQQQQLETQQQRQQQQMQLGPRVSTVTPLQPVAALVFTSRGNSQAELSIGQPVTIRG